MSPAYNSLFRTTCVATMLQGGHAENALPQLAQATVNCRMFPGSTPEQVRRVLQQAIADTQVVVRVAPPEATPSPPSPLRPDVLSVLDRLTAKHFPGATVVPAMEIGASDGLFFRNAGIPVYNVSALANDFNDDRAHGRDERVLQKSFYDSIAFWDEMVRALAGAATSS
jgi:acetylornithine deacetylase/succinyl-diaminopimelate desuccinylase-like protein